MIAHLVSRSTVVRLLSTLSLVGLITMGAWALPSMVNGVWAQGGADLSPSTKSVDRTTASTGDVLTYQIVLRNQGAPTIAVLADPVPALTTFVPGSITGGAVYRPLRKEVAWAGLARAASPVTVTFQVRVDHQGTLGWPPITNAATIRDLQTDETITRTATTLVNLPDLSPSTKSVDKHYGRNGDRLSYTILLTNQGVRDATSVLLTDTVPSGTSYVPGSGSASKGSFAGTSGLMWTGPISVGESVTVTFDVTVTVGTGGAGGTLLWPIANVAYIDDGLGAVISRTATTIANPIRTLVPAMYGRWVY
jgi:uncharacterized repeat protein (TIGR01451 family)